MVGETDVLISPASAPPKLALLVLGVGRSGTSALTRVLSLLGAALPNAVLGPGGGNERGHWEPERILSLNEEVLALHRSSWFDTGAFPRRWFESEQAATFVDRAARLIAEEYGGQPFIVLKEPRISRLAPVYIAALAQAGYALRVVIPLRHPSEVIGSLARRDGTDPRASELIWIRHILEAEAATRRLPRAWVDYDSLLGDWRSVQARISAVLDIRWPNEPETVAAEIAAFLEPALRHFDARRDGTHEAVGPVADRLWRAARAGLAGDETSLQAEFHAVGLVVDEIDRLGAVRIEEAERAAAAEADALRAAAAERQTALQLAVREAEGMAEAAQEELRVARQGLSAQADELVRLRLELSALSEKQAADADLLRTLSAEAGELRAHLAARDLAMDAVVGSRSWRLAQLMLWPAGRIARLRG